MRRLAAAAAAAATLAAAPAARAYDVTGRTIAALHADLAADRVTAVALVAAYEARIRRYDRGPGALAAVLALNPDAGQEAAASDARRARGATLGPLDGIPILVKDNIETADPLPTTAGSLALVANVTGRDAPLIARLRAAGAVILGKTNLSEWANFRSGQSVSGWSGRGGLTRNPYDPARSACGSSSGSAAAVAASLAAAAIGTETDGSVTCPAAMNGVVGIKPTLGLVSRTGVVPISPAQDTPGSLAHDVADAALLLHTMAGTDPQDPATAPADAHRPAAAMADAPLRGVRVGVLRFAAGHNEATDAVFARALDTLRAGGAVLTEITAGPDMDALGRDEGTALTAECKTALDHYLAATPPAVRVRSVADLIRFDRDHAARELALFGQDQLVRAEGSGGASDPAARAARAAAAARAGWLVSTLAGGHYDALVAPTDTPAFLIDTVDGDHDGGSAAELPAVAGLPHLVVPMGTVQGLPVGMSWIGARWADDRVLALGAAFARAVPPLPPPLLRRVAVGADPHALLAPAAP